MIAILGVRTLTPCSEIVRCKDFPAVAFSRTDNGDTSGTMSPKCDIFQVLPLKRPEAVMRLVFLTLVVIVDVLVLL